MNNAFCFLILFNVLTLNAMYGPLNGDPIPQKNYPNQKSLEDIENQEILKRYPGWSLKDLKRKQQQEFTLFCQKNNLPIDNVPSELMNVNGWEAYIFDVEDGGRYVLPMLPVYIKEDNYFGYAMKNDHVQNFIKDYCVKIEVFSNANQIFYTLLLWHQSWYQRAIKEMI